MLLVPALSSLRLRWIVRHSGMRARADAGRTLSPAPS